MTDSSAPDLVPTDTAARALGFQAHTLSEWADSGGVRCTATDENGHRLWDLDDLRAQVVAYVKEHGGSLQDIDDESQP